MMRTFACLVLVAFCGCGDGIDPKLCNLHAEQARLGNEENKGWAALRHQEIDKEVSDRIRSLDESRKYNGGPVPVYDCPKCDKLFERSLLDRQ